MAVVFEKTKMLTDTVFHYCPGCNHGIAHRLVGEAIEELGLSDNVIGVAPVGCSVFAYNYFNCDMYEAAHGRAPAVATGIIHPDVAYDLMSDPKWVNVKSYSDPDGIYEGEIGKIENVRFVETSEAKVFEGAGAAGRDVYATLILGDNAYGTTEIEGGGLTLIVKQLGSGGAQDPLDQRASVAWKATKAAVRLQEAYMVRIETTSTFTGA